MYIPKDCTTLEEAPPQQIRAGIQGYGGTGKTVSALTFPNPIVADIDRGLGIHYGRKDVIVARFWDQEWCKKVNPNHKWLKDTLVYWLNKEGPKLEADQTLVLDGGTGLDYHYHRWYAANPAVTKAGNFDDYAEYRLKIAYMGDIFEAIFKTIQCNVVFLSHEYEKPDKLGEWTGKIRPLMSGQYCNKLSGQFTDWFRQLSSNKIAPEKVDEKVMKNWKMTKEEYLKMQDTFPGSSIYYWQTESDEIFDAKCSSMVAQPRFVPASYQSILKYRRPVVTK